MKSQRVNDAISAALLAYSDQQAGLSPDRQRFHYALTKPECEELAKVVRAAINGAGCVVCEIVDE